MKKNTAEMVLVFISILMVPSLLVSCTYAHDPGWYDPQPAAYWSALETNDGQHIMDDTFASYIEQYIIPKGYLQMYFVFGQCFSGGFLDELEQVIKNNPRRIPSVMISASRYDESSYGSLSYNGEDYFLREFAKALEAYDGYDYFTAPRIDEAWYTARINDPCGPYGSQHSKDPEHPQKTQFGDYETRTDPLLQLLGKAARDVYGGPDMSYKAILWVGLTNEDRYWVDLNHIHKVLTQKYGFRDQEDIYVMFGSGTWYGSTTLNDGGKIDSPANYDNMEDTIQNWLAPQMNDNTQFFFWASDHGDGCGCKQSSAYAPCTYSISLSPSFVRGMTADPDNTPYVSVSTRNVTSPDNRVYLNGYLLGTLSPTGLGGTGYDIFYFDDSIIPIYSHTENLVSFELSQPEPYEVSNVTIATGGIDSIAVPESPYSVPVGGLTIQTNNAMEMPNLLSPYLGLSLAIISATVATTTYTKRLNKREKKQQQ